MKYQFVDSVIANNMSHFQIDSGTSVIKAAPARNQSHFSPKDEPIELTDRSLQDLNKMQPATLEYSAYYSPRQGPFMSSDYSSTIIQTQNNSQIYYNPFPGVSNASNNILSQDWPPMPYQFQQVQQSQRTPSTSNNHYQHSQQENNHNDQRICKMNDLLCSPVDSGIGSEFNLVDIKSEFFVGQPTQVVQSQGTPGNCDMSTPSMERRDTANSHREHSPVIIPKIQNALGFQYQLEAPISTSIRKEDDRMTYVNKGQYYTVKLKYILDQTRPLKCGTVRSQIMVVFREDKTYDDEIKTWQLWYQRQSGARQRILEVDQKNSTGFIGHIEEVSHNAVQFCWDPTDTPQISIAVQCLSTDFSTQKGVKGLPLHVQIDTYDGDNAKVFHRGYCQIKVFCDKGANRKMLHETRRDEKRKGGGRKKSDGEFHEPCDTSDFYHMSELEKNACLFVPFDDFDTRTVEATIDVIDPIMEPVLKRPRTAERVMIYVRKPEEEIYTPLHLTPPSLGGLYHALYQKYSLDENKIAQILKKCYKGITVKIDDDMVRHYSNHDSFVLEVEPSVENPNMYTITLIEEQSNQIDCRTSMSWPPSLQQSI